MEQTPSCKYFRLLADEYIEGELTGEEMREFEAHIAECPECRKEFEELRALKEMLAESDEEIPEGLHERIMNAVSSEIKPRGNRLRVLRRAAVSAACAVICLSLTVAFALIPLWQENTGSGLPDDPITNEAAAGETDIRTDINFSVDDNTEIIIDIESEAVNKTPEAASTEAENLPSTLPDAETVAPSPVESDEKTYLAAESTAGGKIPDTQPETAKPATEAPVAETESLPTETPLKETTEAPTELESEADEEPGNISALFSPDGELDAPSPEANTAPGGDEITFALLIVSGLLAVASFIAFLISLSSVRNTPSKKNREEEK